MYSSETSSYGAANRPRAAERVDQLDDAGTEDHDEERRKEAEHQRKYELDANLGGALFCTLPPLGARHFGICAKRVCDAGAEPVGLHEHGHERSHVVNLRACREVFKRLDARLSGAVEAEKIRDEREAVAFLRAGVDLNMRATDVRLQLNLTPEECEAALPFLKWKQAEGRNYKNLRFTAGGRE